MYEDLSFCGSTILNFIQKKTNNIFKSREFNQMSHNGVVKNNVRYLLFFLKCQRDLVHMSSHFAIMTFSAKKKRKEKTPKTSK